MNWKSGLLLIDDLKDDAQGKIGGKLICHTQGKIGDNIKKKTGGKSTHTLSGKTGDYKTGD